MKKQCVIIIAAMLVLCLALASCGLGGEKKKAETTEDMFQTEAITTPQSTEAALAASADPMTAASRGLTFTSKGDGTCTLSGIGSCKDACLIIPDKSEGGETVTGIAPSALAGNTFVTAVQIPAGVVEIGSGAFGGCTSLAYILVADGNSAYCDYGGILYSADGSTLLCIPAGGSYNSVTLTCQVTRIADSATAGCTGLKKILYEGSREGWKSVSVGNGNDVLTSVEIVFMTQSGK